MPGVMERHPAALRAPVTSHQPPDSPQESLLSLLGWWLVQQPWCRVEHIQGAHRAWISLRRKQCTLNARRDLREPRVQHVLLKTSGKGTVDRAISYHSLGGISTAVMTHSGMRSTVYGHSGRLASDSCVMTTRHPQQQCFDRVHCMAFHNVSFSHWCMKNTR